MTDPAKKATGVLFVILVLLGVALWISLTIQQGLEGSLIVRDVPINEKVVERRLLSDDIVQGSQLLPPADETDLGKPHRDFSRLPSAYWHPYGPVGQLFDRLDWFPGKVNTWRADARLPASLVAQSSSLSTPMPLPALATLWSQPAIGVVQMKAGALAGYGRPYQVIDFYESNPDIVELSQPKDGVVRFTYLRDALARGALVRVFPGPELMALSEGPAGFYHFLFVETARQGDKVADELLTKDAFATYLHSLAPGGILAVHVSSAGKELPLAVTDRIQELGLHAKLGRAIGAPEIGYYPSDWLMIARQPGALDYLRSGGPQASVRWHPLMADGRP